MKNELAFTKTKKGPQKDTRGPGYRIQHRGMTKDNNSCAVFFLGNQFKLKEEAQTDSRKKVARKKMEMRNYLTV